MDVGAVSTLTLGQAVYTFKGVDQQASELLESTRQIEANLTIARNLRQNSHQLNSTEKTWVDGVLLNTDKTLDNVKALLEPARVDMQTNFGNVGFSNRAMFVLRDSPKVQTNIARLTIASSSLDHVLGVLFTRQGPIAQAQIPPPLRPNAGYIDRRSQRISRMTSQTTISSDGEFSNPPAYPSPAPSEPPESPQRLYPTQNVYVSPAIDRPHSRGVTDEVLELPDTSSYASEQRRQTSQSWHRQSTQDARPGLGVRYSSQPPQSPPQRTSVSSLSPPSQSQQYSEPVMSSVLGYARPLSQPLSPPQRKPVGGPAYRQLPSQQPRYAPSTSFSDDKIAVVDMGDANRYSMPASGHPSPPMQTLGPSEPSRHPGSRSSVSSGGTMSPVLPERDTRSVIDSVIPEVPPKSTAASRRKNWLAYQAGRRHYE